MLSTHTKSQVDAGAPTIPAMAHHLRTSSYGPSLTVLPLAETQIRYVATFTRCKN